MSLLDPRLWLAFVIWTALIAGGAYWKGNASGQNAVLVQKLAADNKALTDRIAENEKARQELAEDAKKASKDHEDELKRVRDTARRDAGKRVPISANFCKPAGATESAAPTGDGQADARATFLPDAFAGDLRQLAADADEVTADLRNLKRRAEEAACFN